MTCVCGSARIAHVDGKCDDKFCYSIVHLKVDRDSEYVLGVLNIGNGDNMELSYCLDCGRIQGQFPVKDTDILEAIEDLDQRQKEYRQGLDRYKR